MRVSPLICWQCKNWFNPITRRAQKYCSDACRVDAFNDRQAELERKKSGWVKDNSPAPDPVHSDHSVVTFNFESKEQIQEFRETCRSHCKDSRSGCLECWYENNFKSYRFYVAKYGRDQFDRSMDDWIRLGQP